MSDIKWFADSEIEAAVNKQKNDLRKAGLQIERDAKILCPVDTGRLRASIITTDRHEGNKYIVTVGTNIKYACIFSGSKVLTIDGWKFINSIKIGDMVLTQTGEYHKVIDKFEFSAKEKPNLITIEFEWRKGSKKHKLTVTEDHKILVYRDGRNKWIEAKDLVEGDSLYQLKKINPKKGTAKVKVCINCKNEYQSQGKKFCSEKCWNEYWNKGNNPHLGMKRSKETKQLQSKKKIEYLKNNPDKHVNCILAGRKKETQPQKKVRLWLEEREINYIQQYYINGKWVDFYLPEKNMIIEADGAYWHQDQNIDIERDKQILKGNNLSITHIHFYDKNYSPKLNLNPINNSYYVSCNPGPDSFVDLETFKFSTITKITKWTYEKRHKRDALMGKLYDLTIDKVHSFYCNGCLISNSCVEFGTSRMSAHPFLRPAFDRALARLRR